MCFIGGENLYLGITATVNDIDVMRTLGADFIELLVQKDDDIKDIERLLMSGHEAFVLHAPEHVDVDGTTVLLDLAADDGPVREHSVLRVNEDQRDRGPLWRTTGGPSRRDKAYEGRSSSIDGPTCPVPELP